jgi:hypothetical protein
MNFDAHSAKPANHPHKPKGWPLCLDVVVSANKDGRTQYLDKLNRLDALCKILTKEIGNRRVSRNLPASPPTGF